MTKSCDGCHYQVSEGRCMRRKQYVAHGVSEPPVGGFWVGDEISLSNTWRGTLKRVEGDVCGPDRRNFIKKDVKL